MLNKKSRDVMMLWRKIFIIVFFLLLNGVQTSIAADSSEETLHPGFISSIEKRLVSFVHKTVSNMRYTAYKLGGSHFDTSRGIYVLDCSTYVDHILEVIHPNAYTSLINSSGSEKPTTREYYNFFTRLTDDSDYWNKIDNVEELRPGDILVFRNKGRHSSGHVMVVMNPPTKQNNTYDIRVADSAPSGHSEDTRSRHNSGIGIGTLQLKANPKGEPSAYAWKVGSCWKKNVNIAMARPYDAEAG
jgi:cell wall-associated NlpC family hydrolase